jgi:hypothetical protein
MPLLIRFVERENKWDVELEYRDVEFSYIDNDGNIMNVTNVLVDPGPFGKIGIIIEGKDGELSFVERPTSINFYPESVRTAAPAREQLDDEDFTLPLKQRMVNYFMSVKQICYHCGKFEHYDVGPKACRCCYGKCCGTCDNCCNRNAKEPYNIEEAIELYRKTLNL